MTTTISTTPRTCTDPSCPRAGQPLWPSHTYCPSCRGPLAGADAKAARSPLDDMLGVVIEHAATLAAPAYPLDPLDVVQLLRMTRATAEAALPHAVRAALGAGASAAEVDRMLGRGVQAVAVSA